ncbi:MAG: FAD-dependent oxidoreductase [Pseudomonadota bacterium]
MTRIAVIGRGLIGAAAARHLAEAGADVVLIGPDEPADKARHLGVFGSHYDEGRITRVLATDRFWSEVSHASIARYRDIEARSGIGFFTACGAMMAGPEEGGFVDAVRTLRADFGDFGRVYGGPELASAFPFFAFPDEFVGFHEPGGGHISPRRLVAAQTALAEAAGAAVIRAEVTALGETGSVEIETLTDRVRCDTALIATGAMADHLAPRPLGQRVYARTVAFFEVSAAQAATLDGMPSLVFRLRDGAAPYLLPPIRYPDGRYYLKLGGDPVDRTLQSAKEIGDWFRGGGEPAVRDHLERVFRRLMPSVAIRAVRMAACVTTFTPSGRPVIDWLTPRIAIASGGNGAGAKCSDELGRRAARLVIAPEDPVLAETRLSEGVSI